MTTPTPATIARIAERKRAEAQIPPPPAAPQLIVVAEPTDPGKVVTLGRRDSVVESIHDGVVRTKHLRVGARVRAFIKGQARGSERIVKSVTKIDDGEFWHVEFASAHPDQDYKAAYRWFDESLVGTTVQHIVKVPAFVPAHV